MGAPAISIFLCDHISFKSIWCRLNLWGRESQRERRVAESERKKETERKRQTQNKTQQKRLQLFGNLDLKRQGYTARSKYSWSLGNYGTGPEVGETELSQEQHCRSLLLGLLGQGNLNLLSRWTGSHTGVPVFASLLPWFSKCGPQNPGGSPWHKNYFYNNNNNNNNNTLQAVAPMQQKQGWVK